MRTHGTRRPGNIWLLGSALLLTLFVFLAVVIMKAEDDQNVVDPHEQAALTTSAFAPTPPPPNATAFTADGGGWPQWRGVHRDGVAWTSAPLAGLPEQILWEEPAGRGFGSCAVVGGRFYAMQRDDDQEVVLCRSAVTGKEIWRQSYATPWPGEVAPQYGFGPRSTPTVADNHVYTVGITGLLQCRKIDQGELVWQVDLLSEYVADMPKWGIACSPLVDGDRVIVVPGGTKGTVVALDRKTGKPLWASSGLDGPPGYSSPVVADIEGKRQVVAVTGKMLAGLDEANGRVLWSYAWRTQFDVNAASPLAFETINDGQTSHYVFITSGYNQGCALLRIKREGDVFSASQVFRSRRLRSQIGTPVRHGDHVYGFDENTLTCLDLRTGDRVWQQNGFERGSLVVVGDRMVILGENGILALADASPTGYHELARREPFGKDQPRCWTMPVIAGDRLYLRGQPPDNDSTPGRWLCLDLKNIGK